MNTLFQYNRLIVFFLAVGFLVLGFEIFLMHYDLLSEKKFTWIPIIFGVCGGLITILISIVFNRLSYYCFYFVMIVSILVGFMGLYFHNKWRFPAFYDFIFNRKELSIDILTSYTPLLAPSAFIAMGTLGILVALYFKWGNEN